MLRHRLSCFASPQRCSEQQHWGAPADTCNIQYGFPRTFSVVTRKLAQLTAIDRVGQL